MAAIKQTTISYQYFLRNWCILIQFPLKCVLNDPVNAKPPIYSMMSLHRISHEAFSEDDDKLYGILWYIVPLFWGLLRSHRASIH